MEKDAFAALLESLCERPFAGAADERTPALDASAGGAGPSPDAAEPYESARAPADDPGPATADVPAILSGTATDAQCQAFQQAAMRSSAVRLEAQAALAFLDGIEAAPIAAPARLVEQVLEPAGGAPSRVQPGIWSRLFGDLTGRRAGRVAAACAVMLMAGGLSWSLLWRADSSRDGAAPPAATSPPAGTPLNSAEPKPVFAPSATPLLLPPAASPMPPALPGPASPLAAPPLAISPASPAFAPVPEPVPLAPPAQALADPCAPGSFVTQEARPRPKVEVKPAPNQPQSRTAAVSAPDPGCGVNGSTVEVDRNPQGDQGTVRAARPAARIGRSDRQAPAAAASAPAAMPAKRPAPSR